MVIVKRYDKFLKELAKGVERPCPKASGKDNPTVGVYEILPTNCMRKASYYERKLAGISAAVPEPTTTMSYIQSRAIECVIGSISLAKNPLLERHKQHEKAGIACYTMTFPTRAQ